VLLRLQLCKIIPFLNILQIIHSHLLYSGLDHNKGRKSFINSLNTLITQSLQKYLASTHTHIISRLPELATKLHTLEKQKNKNVRKTKATQLKGMHRLLWGNQTMRILGSNTQNPTR
jgi:hypothetical protein